MSIQNPYEQVDQPDNPHAWREQSLCAQVGGRPFFPEKSESVAEAKSICAKCDVREQCLVYALENNERFGVWGGKSERERHAIVNGTTEKRLTERIEADARVAALLAELGSVEQVAEALDTTTRKINHAINRHNKRMSADAQNQEK